jgi:hypothetical protein
MPKFVDREQRSWEISINVASMKRVKDATGVNLGLLLTDNMKPLADLMQDPIALVDVMYVLCKPDADKRSVSDVEFGESLAGESFEHACDAFMEALIDFFPKRQGDLLRTMLGKGKEIQDALAAKVMTHLSEMHTELASDSQESSE